jgi:hypothetical protein
MLADRTIVSARPSHPPGGALLVERTDCTAPVKTVELDDIVTTGDASFDASYTIRVSPGGAATLSWLTRSRRAALVQFETKLRAVHQRAWYCLQVDDEMCQLVWAGMEVEASVLDSACGVVAACSR